MYIIIISCETKFIFYVIFVCYCSCISTIPATFYKQDNFFKTKTLDFSGCPVVGNPPANVAGKSSVPHLGRAHLLHSN